MSASPSAYRGVPVALRFNMARYCLAAAGDDPGKTALLVVHDPKGSDVETWSYRALEDAVLRAAYAFRVTYGLNPGSHVAIRLRNRTSYAVSFFGAIAGGLVPVPVSPDLTQRELAFILNDSEANAIVLDESLPHGTFDPGLQVIAKSKLIHAITTGSKSGYADTAADAPAFLIYTSGTTANPKGVLHAHRSAWGRRPMYQGWYDLRRSDRLMHAGSFNWTYTLGTGLTDPWANGATSIVYTGEKDPAVWPRLIQDNGVTMFAAVPGVYRQMLKYGDISTRNATTLRHGLTAGEALPLAVAAEWEERTATKLYEALGQSELSTYISSAPAIPIKSGCIGKPQPGRAVRIIAFEGGAEALAAGEEGLIAVHRADPGLMLGYWKREKDEAEVFRGDWFIGGDAGILDEEGYVTHMGRHNDLMNAGGFRVSPAEVEQILARHPAVADVAVAEIGVGDGVSIIAAFIVPREGEQTNLASALSNLARTDLATYKRPREYVFVPSLPRTPNGKVKRAELKTAFRAG